MALSGLGVGSDAEVDVVSPVWSSVAANNWATQNYDIGLTDHIDHISQMDLHSQHDSREDAALHSRSMGKYQNICDATLATSPAKNNMSTSRHDPKPGNKAVHRKTRTRRACDQCNISRIKCNGQQPCVRCADFELDCAYMRPRKKRARISKKVGTSTIKVPEKEQTLPESCHNNSAPTIRIDRTPSSIDIEHHSIPGVHVVQNTLETLSFQSQNDGQNKSPRNVETRRNVHRHLESLSSSPNSRIQTETTGNNTNTGSLRSTSGLNDNLNQIMSLDGQHEVHTIKGHCSMDLSGVYYSPISDDVLDQNPNSANLGPQTQLSTPADTDQRYPVLQPLLPYLRGPLNVTLASILLEGYFLTTPGGYVPSSPFLLGHMLRRHSFLRYDCPRKCSPALLASILWVTAETTDEPFSTLPPTTRSSVCQTLLDITLALLQPIARAQTFDNRRGLPLTQHSFLLGDTDCGALDATGSFDDVITFVHLATVISAGRYKSASFRWWHSALQLAKELRLNHDTKISPVPDKDFKKRDDLWDDLYSTGEDTTWFSNNYQFMVETPSPPLRGTNSTVPLVPAHVHDISSHFKISYIAEEREERRRVWWTLYILDRHLALSFNSPLVIREIDCEGMFFPDSENRWQEPEVYSDHDSTLLGLQQWNDVQGTKKLSSLHQLGQGTFTFFIPLMSILGQIIDFQHARNHPKLGKIYRGEDFQHRFIQEVGLQLDAYKKSLDQLIHVRHNNSSKSELFKRGSYTRSSHTLEKSKASPVPHLSKFDLYRHTVAAYGNFFVHVMYILLYGKWDLTSLFEDENNMWMSQPAFLQTLNHVIAAADSLENILEFDSDFSLNPYLLGIYLLQGSFIPFVIAEKCQNKTSPAILKACEGFVRAHEICMVTLHTDYQRKYQKLMRSTIASAKGRNNRLSGDELKRQRESLTLYRWAGKGMGLGV